MPDRVIRDEISESDRWLDLPSDTDRLAFLMLVLKVDDFGNTEAGLTAIFRYLAKSTQVKTVEHTAVVLTHLADADLIRSYAVAGRAFWHLPRLRPHRQYLVRKCPSSPWDRERKLGKTQRVEVRGLAKSQALGEDIATTSLLRSNDVAQGVGVGVGVGVGGSSSKNKGIVGLTPDPDPKLLAGKALRDSAKRVLECLNRNAGRKYEPVDSNIKPILARMREGYTERDLCAIAAVKARQWKGDEKMQAYIRPKTLFNATNAGNYRAELPANKIEEVP